jgi:UMF1 family MFS transporter
VREPTPPAPPRRAVVGWVLFDVAAQPVFTLVTTFVFAPYFAARVAPTPADGQALWGFATAAAGLTIALLAPILGAVADATGRRKRWIALFSSLVVLGCCMLWWSIPGAEWAVPVALIGFVVATVGVEFATAFTNAMMPGLVPPERLGRLSGLGWACGYAGGLVSLALILVFFAADPTTGRTLAGLAPVLGLDPATSEGDRAAGPFSAIWYVLFITPLFLWTPDSPAGLKLRLAVRSGIAQLAETVAHVRSHRNVLLYLVAHMVYADGLVALFAFGGIYAAGSFGWTTIELGVFGILLTISGTAGALIGGPLDDRLGPKTVVLGALGLLALASLGILSVDREHVLFFLPVAPPVPGDGLFASAPEQVYLGLGLLIGAVGGPLQSASRTLLCRLAPQGRMTEFFGLFALSGKVTSFAAPLLVGLVTAITASQRIGISLLLVFFVGGALILLRVQVPPAR